ncbi:MULTISPECIES: DUF4336 domain-containing protein [Prochlorococcus]|uniref:DUF4336 domain-containing protein n=1 Tax=Prochlorococcus TaxID=1218 RepID=UPI00053381A2|nr:MULTISPECIES: DUF4336 domain-containing protein [Prochlorococcus]KGG12300.1 hypothetical protein EV05_1510 [Prochlorococcus sp. MIT 0601]
MKESISTKKSVNKESLNWPWWPLFPLYPYGLRKTFFKEIVPNKIWSFEQLQGLYYVAVPVRLTVIKTAEGLMLINPLPPTDELIHGIHALEDKHGPVVSIVLPTASGLEHKISMPALSRSFPKAILWVCPGQWTFPINLPLSWIGLPKARTRTLFIDGLPHSESCDWISLGPLDIGLGRFQEVACFHKSSGSLVVTDALVGIDASPPELFDYDPTPLLFHARESGEEPLVDDPSLRRKGWARLVLFASFLKPEKLSIPPISVVIKNAFKPGLRTLRTHYGIYPFLWDKDWENSTKELLGQTKPLLQVAPVLERLVFPRAKSEFLKWLDKLIKLKGMRTLISSHYSAPIAFNTYDCRQLIRKISLSNWSNGEGNRSFLDSVDKNLLKKGVVPRDPLAIFKD